MSKIILYDGSTLEISARVLLDLSIGETDPFDHWEGKVAPGSVAQMDQARETVAGTSAIYEANSGWWLWSPGKGRWVPETETAMRLRILRYNGVRFGEMKTDRNGENGTRAMTQLTDARENDVLKKMQKICTIERFFNDALPSFGLGPKFTAVLEPGAEHIWQTPHPDLRCRIGLDIEGETIQPADDLIAAIDRVIAAPNDPDLPIYREQLLEWLGFSMLGAATRLQRGLAIKGGFKGGNGKGWLFDLIASLFPPDARKQVTGTLDYKMDFGIQSLDGRRVFLAREIDDVKGIKVLNGFITGDTLDARRLGGHRYDLQVKTGVACDFNEWPELPATQLGGVARRWCPIFAVQRLQGTMPAAELARISIEQVPGLAFLALQAAQRCWLRGETPTPLTAKQEASIAEWLQDSDPVAVWVGEVMTSGDEDDFESTELMWSLFDPWRVICQHKPITERVFSKRLSRYLPELGGRKGKNKEQTIRGWRRVRMKLWTETPPIDAPPRPSFGGGDASKTLKRHFKDTTGTN